MTEEEKDKIEKAFLGVMEGKVQCRDCCYFGENILKKGAGDIEPWWYPNQKDFCFNQNAGLDFPDPEEWRRCDSSGPASGEPNPAMIRVPL
jgi:hypothetical protein